MHHEKPGAYKSDVSAFTKSRQNKHIVSNTFCAFVKPNWCSGRFILILSPIFCILQWRIEKHQKTAKQIKLAVDLIYQEVLGAVNIT